MVDLVEISPVERAASTPICEVAIPLTNNVNAHAKRIRILKILIMLTKEINLTSHGVEIKGIM